MPILPVPDSLGHTIKLYVHEKKPWHMDAADFNTDMLENMPDYSLRDDDVLLCSYPKSGCHWVWEITRMLMAGRTEVDDVDKENCMMEYSKAPTTTFDIEAMASPRVLNNHQHFDNQPKDIIKKRNKVIFVYRNPKDVAVSFYYHHTRLDDYDYTGTNFTSYLPRFVDGLVDNGSVWDYLRGWEAAMGEGEGLDVCVVGYEDMQTDPLKEVQKLATFLGKLYGDDFLTSIIKATSIDSMRTAKVKAVNDDAGSVFYRKGKVGDWKNHFTVAQSEWFDHVTRTRMGGSKMFKFKYQI